MGRSKKQSECSVCPLCDQETLPTQFAVFCEGSCRSWFHTECMGMSKDHYTMIQKHKKEKWVCPPCEPIHQDSLDLNIGKINDISDLETVTFKPSFFSGKTLDEIKLQLSPTSENTNNVINDEDALRMAGEIGNALLEEIQVLKSENMQQSSNLLALTIKIEDLKSDNERLLGRHDELLQLLHESEKQIGKLREEKITMRNFYEEHDYGQIKIIQSHEEEIQLLQRTLQKLKNDKMIAGEGSSTSVAQIEATEGGEVIKANNIDMERLTGQLNKLSNSYMFMENRLASLELKLSSEVSNANDDGNVKAYVSHQYAGDREARDIIIRPPVSAKLLPEGDTFEDFFNNNIDEFLASYTVSSPSIKTQGSAVLTQTLLQFNESFGNVTRPEHPTTTSRETKCHFLEERYWGKTKQKRFPGRGRVFIHSDRKNRLI